MPSSLRGTRIGCLLVSGTASLAQSAPDVADLVGAPAAGGETQLEARGYALVTTNTVRDTKFTTWWNGRQRRCISVATSNGRYNTINGIPEANCDSAGDRFLDRPRMAFRNDARGPEGRFDGANDRPAQQYGSGDDRLTLVCFGSGSGLKTRSYSSYSYDRKEDRFRPEYGSTVGRESFNSDVQVEIADGRGRIHVQGQLVSPIHSGGIDGWWPIQDLVVTPDRITGTYRMNGLNKPKINIDRRTGTIKIKESTEFSGRCDVGNWRSGF